LSQPSSSLYQVRKLQYHFGRLAVLLENILRFCIRTFPERGMGRSLFSSHLSVATSLYCTCGPRRYVTAWTGFKQRMGFHSMRTLKRAHVALYATLVYATALLHQIPPSTWWKRVLSTLWVRLLSSYRILTFANKDGWLLDGLIRSVK